MQLSERLLHLRMENKLSQLDVAAALNTSRQTVSKWETGATIPTSEKLIGLAKLYDVSIDILVGHTVKSEKDTESPEEHERHIESPAELTEPASLVENSEPFVATQSGKKWSRSRTEKRLLWGLCALLLVILCYGFMTRNTKKVIDFGDAEQVDTSDLGEIEVDDFNK